MAALHIIGWHEGDIRIEDIRDGLVQQFHEPGSFCGYIPYTFFTQLERWVVVVGACMLDEQ